MDYYIIDDQTIQWMFVNYFQWVVEHNDDIPNCEQLDQIRKDCIRKALSRKTYGTASLLNKETYQKAETFKEFLKIMYKHTDKFG